MIWLYFAVCATVITVAGMKLSRYGDAIAKRTGLGGVWIGVVLVATVTSLPELVTGISAVTVADSPDIAVGDVLGSCVFNLLIIVVLDFLHRSESLFTRASPGHILAAALGVGLIGFAGFNILLSAQGADLEFAHIGLYTPFIALFYFISARTIYRYEVRQFKKFTETEADRYPALSLRQLFYRYAVASAFVVIAGSFLPTVGKTIAGQMGWYESFVGTLLIAFATSLPEIVVTIAALRLGAIDMAIGNLLGSNLFNIFVLSIDDLVYTKGALLNDVSPAHTVSALSAIMMTGVVMVGLFYRPRVRLLGTVGWVSVFLFCTYLVNTYLLFLYGH